MISDNSYRFIILLITESIPSLINIIICPIGRERNERAAMYAKTGRANSPTERE